MTLISLLAHRGRVRVINANSDDLSTISVSNVTIQSLLLSHGDVVHVKARNRKATVLVILTDEDMDNGNARVPAVEKYNLGVSDGDTVRIMPCLDIKSVSSIEGLKVNIFKSNT